MFQVKNGTPFATSLFVLPDPEGIDTLYVSVKGSFEIGVDELRVAEIQPVIVEADEHWGEPGKSSLRYAGEAHPCKAATDVVLVGEGYVPSGRPAPYFGVFFSVGCLQKTIHVYGDRVWRVGTLGCSPSEPIPTVSVPLIYERAYGGKHELDDGSLLVEARNPVGVGFQGKRRASEMEGLPVPNLVDPSHPIRVPSDDHPIGCGYIGPGWEPRIRYGGTYDEEWRRKRAPYLPDDFDARFLQTAPPDQVYPGYLRGGEPVELLHCSPVGTQRFKVPVCQIDAVVRIAGRTEKPELRIETLLLEPDQARFSLLWKGAVRCDKEALKVECVELALKALTGVKC